MAAGKYNVKADQGSTFVLDFVVSTDNVPWNLTGYTARMQVRAFTSSPTTLLDLSTGNGIVVTASGRVTVTVSAGDMSDVVAGKHYYDLELASAGGEVTRILEGRFVVAAEVSR